PHSRPMERRDADARNGILRIPDARVAARDGRPWSALRCADLPVDSSEEPRRGRVLGHPARSRRGAGHSRAAITSDTRTPTLELRHRNSDTGTPTLELRH